MAVDAQFTASPSSGNSPLIVSFTDTSTGSPDHWLWDFGDGTFSDEQHPTHTFTGDTGTSWSVKLEAWVSSLEQSISMSLINPPKFSWTPGFVASSLAAAWDLFEPANYSTTQRNTGPVEFVVTNDNDTFWGFNAKKVSKRVAVPATSGGADQSVFVVEVACEAMSGFKAGTVISDQGGTADVSGMTPNIYVPFFNITGFMGSNFDASYSFITTSIMGDPGTDNQGGGRVAFRAREYQSSSWDTVTLNVTIGIAQADVFIDFVGTPLIGTSPLGVQFTDLSNVDHAISVWDFGDGNSVTVAGMTHPFNTYTTDACSIDLL